MNYDITKQLYLLAHNLQNQNLIDYCTEYLRARYNVCSLLSLILSVDLDNVEKIWSVANATGNGNLIAAVVPLIAINWEAYISNEGFFRKWINNFA